MDWSKQHNYAVVIPPIPSKRDRELIIKKRVLFRDDLILEKHAKSKLPDRLNERRMTWSNDCAIDKFARSVRITFFLRMIPRKMLKLFVYHLSSQYNLDIVDQIERVAHMKLGVKNWLSAKTQVRFSHFENLRTHGADYIIWRQLQSRMQLTNNVHDADLYLVPFLGGLNTILGWGHGLSRIDHKMHKQATRHWNEWASRHLVAWKQYSHRHIILYNMNGDQVPLQMLPATVLHLGPARLRPQHIVVPYLILEESFFKKTTRAPKRDLFAYLQSSSSRNHIRGKIAHQMANHQDVVVDTSVIGKRAHHTVQMMRRSKFCITPAGDSASFFTRFYFALLSGCIPVRVETYHSEDSYPYVGEHHSISDVAIIIDFHTVNTNGLMAALHRVRDTERRMQLLKRMQSSLLYTPPTDPHVEMDAVSRIVEQLEARKKCAEMVVVTRSLHDVHIGTECLNQTFLFDEEMCWTCKISLRDVIQKRLDIIQASMLC